MGIQLKAVTVKWDTETTRMSDELQAKFSPFVEGRSQLTRVAIKKLYLDVIAQGTVATIGACLQGLPSISSSPAEIPNSLYPKFTFKARLVQ